MSFRDKLRQLRQDWDAASAELERMQARQERRERERQVEKAARVGAGECDQHRCHNTAQRNGKCDDCWAAIFGGIQ